MEQLSLLSMPNEVIETILGFCDFETLCSIARTCRRLHSIQASPLVWKTLFAHRYPRLAACRGDPARPPDLGAGSAAQPSWREAFRRRWQFTEQLCKKLDRIADRCWPLGGLPDPAVTELQTDNQTKLLMVKDTLLELLRNGARHPLPKTEAVARRYYARMLYRELERETMLVRIRQYLQGSGPYADVPAAIHLMDQFMQPENAAARNPYNCEKAVASLAESVLDQLRSASPRHPAVLDQSWRRQRTGHHTLWTDDEVVQVLDAISAVLGRHPELTSYRLHYLLPEREYNQEDVEVTIGGAIAELLQAWRYASVATLLGVDAHLSGCPGTYLIRCLDRLGGALTFVDVARGCVRHTRHSVLHTQAHSLRNMNARWLNPLPTATLLQGMVHEWSGARQAARLLDVDLFALNALFPWLEVNCVLNYHLFLTMLQIYKSIRPDYISRLAKQLRESCTLSEAEERAVDRIETTVRHISKGNMDGLDAQHEEARKLASTLQHAQHSFRLGDIVRHRRYYYLATIVSWTATCEASEAWIDQMGVDRLPGRGRSQPFFSVLACDGSNRYAAHENLELAETPCEIKHVEIGRYFRRFDGTRYEPLPSLLLRYPDPPGRRAVTADAATSAQNAIDGALATVDGEGPRRE